MSVIDEIAAERKRQVEVEGWTVAHDDEHESGLMARAASCYASPHFLKPLRIGVPIGWPWARKWWKPKSRRRDLIRAAALIVAEIEKLDRLAPLTDAKS